MRLLVEATPIPDVAFELLDALQRQARWIRTRGLDLGDLPSVADSSADLVRRAEELRAFLEGELSRCAPRSRST
jgi:hypothetical protein